MGEGTSADTDQKINIQSFRTCWRWIDAAAGVSFNPEGLIEEHAHMSLGDSCFSDDPVLMEVARYWTTIRGDRDYPDRSEFDPLALSPKVWPHLLLVTVEADGRYRYRLVGTAHVERYRFDFTNRTIDEIASGTYLDYLNDLYREAVVRKSPVYSESLFRWDREGFAFTRRVMFPMTSKGMGVNMVLGVQVWPTNEPSFGDYSNVFPEKEHEGMASGFKDGGFAALDRESFQPLDADSWLTQKMAGGTYSREYR